MGLFSSNFSRVKSAVLVAIVLLSFSTTRSAICCDLEPVDNVFAVASSLLANIAQEVNGETYFENVTSDTKIEIPDFGTLTEKGTDYLKFDLRDGLKLNVPVRFYVGFINYLKFGKKHGQKYWALKQNDWNFYLVDESINSDIKAVFFEKNERAAIYLYKEKNSL